MFCAMSTNLRELDTVTKALLREFATAGSKTAFRPKYPSSVARIVLCLAIVSATQDVGVVVRDWRRTIDTPEIENDRPKKKNQKSQCCIARDTCQFSVLRNYTNSGASSTPPSQNRPWTACTRTSSNLVGSGDFITTSKAPNSKEEKTNSRCKLLKSPHMGSYYRLQTPLWPPRCF